MAERRLDGTCARLLGDGTLELRDPNSGLSSDPESKPRHQYRVDGWLLLRRVLPPVSVGDRWCDDDVDEPWWESVFELPDGGPVLDYWLDLAQASPVQYASHAKYAVGHVVAYAPNGCQVRHARDGGLEVQAPHDSYWIRAVDLPAIRREYYGGK